MTKFSLCVHNSVQNPDSFHFHYAESFITQCIHRCFIVSLHTNHMFYVTTGSYSGFKETNISSNNKCSIVRGFCDREVTYRRQIVRARILNHLSV